MPLGVITPETFSRPHEWRRRVIIGCLWKRFERSDPIIWEDTFTALRQVTTQNNTRDQSAGNTKRQVGEIATVIGGGMRIGDRKLGAWFPKGVCLCR